ncbi:MAG: 30S ribosomal protein S4e [Nitrososphaerota archaeon]|jgi:small subunit ribosomal protein S4e|nr:30S ribosomal protein S4e [Nitrososphaerota archaeon]
MGKKSAPKNLKRQAAPAFYSVPRKRYPFITRPSPGPHPRSRSYDLVTLLRDVLRLASTAEEAELILNKGKVLLDRVPRRTPKLPVGLMDVIEFAGTGAAYRLLPARGSVVHPFPVSEGERNLKLCQVTSKSTIRGGRIQVGTHDGRSFIVEDGSKYSVGDSLLVELPSQKILDVVPMQAGYLALVISGKRLGYYGEIQEVIKGTFSTPRSVRLSLSEGEVILPSSLVMPVGKERPLVSLPVRSE